MDQVQRAILYLIAFVLCVAVHEFGHAWMANRLGDPTPRLQGRLTLSPLHHADPIGTIVMPLIMVFTAAPLFAWGKPVQYNPGALTRRYSMRTGQMLVAIAGPSMNLLMALGVSLVIVAAGWLGAPVRLIEALFRYLVQLNIALMIFNLLPIPPLDGGSVLAWALPRSLQHVVDFLARYGTLILIFLVLSPALGLPLIHVIAFPIDLITRLFATGIRLGLGG